MTTARIHTAPSTVTVGGALESNTMIAEATPSRQERTKAFTRAALRYCVVSVAFSNLRSNEVNRAESERLGRMLSWAEEEMLAASGYIVPNGSRDRMALLAEALVGARDAESKEAEPCSE